MCFIYNDYESVYVDLLQMTSTELLYIRSLKIIVKKIFKIMNDLVPVFIKELFTKMMVQYDLRNEYALDITRCKTVVYGINSVHCQSTRLWGSLESTVKNNESII